MTRKVMKLAEKDSEDGGRGRGACAVVILVSATG